MNNKDADCVDVQADLHLSFTYAIRQVFLRRGSNVSRMFVL